MYSLKQIRQDFKNAGVFYTDPKLAEFMKSYLPDDIKEVYDPTCGDGGLLTIFPDDVKKYGQEINPEQLENAKARLKNFEGFCGDTLVNPAFMDRKFDAIIANYPFGIKWQPKMDVRFEACGILPPPSKADFAFILHILHLLSDTGVAVCLSFPGILYRGNKEQQIRQWLVKQNYIDSIIRIGGGFFDDTKIETALLILRKNKTGTAISFYDTVENIKRDVELDEIKNNDFNLSVTSYCQKIVEKPSVDPVALQNEAREAMKQKLIKDIKVDMMICRIEGWSCLPFLNDLKKIIDEMEQLELSIKQGA